MVEALKPRSALAGVYTPGLFGAIDGAPGVEIAERRGLTLTHIEMGDDNPEDALTLADTLGKALPASGKAVDSGTVRTLWLGPARWLVTGSTLPELADKLPNAAINDISSAKTALRLSGPATRDVLASGCPMDLDPSQFKPGMTATTLVGHYTILIDCVEPDTFDLYVARGYALSFWQWLTNVAAEFGYEVLAVD